MKKVKFLRLASVMLMLCLITTCAISGTFAKYTTSDNGSDTARVAKWGVSVTVADGAAFKTAYKSNVEPTKDGVKSETVMKVVAPGTLGELTEVVLTGNPEVMVDVKVDVNLELTNWVIPTDTPYCPLIFKIYTGDNEASATLAKTIKIDATTATTEAIEAMIEKELISTFTGLETNSASITAFETTGFTGTGRYDVNTELDKYARVDWEWEYTQTTAGSCQTNEKDTALGNVVNTASEATAPTISFKLAIDVTQVD